MQTAEPEQLPMFLAEGVMETVSMGLKTKEQSCDTERNLMYYTIQTDMNVKFSRIMKCVT